VPACPYYDKQQLQCCDCTAANLAIVWAQICANRDSHNNNLDCDEDESDSDTSDDEIEVPINHRVLFIVPFEPVTPAVTCVCSHFVAGLSSTCDVKPEYFDIGNGDDSIPDPYRDEDLIEQYQLPRPPEYIDDNIECSHLPRPPEYIDENTFDDIEPSTLPRPPELLVYTAANFVPQIFDDIDISTLPRPPESKPPESERWADIDIEPHEPLRQRYQQQQQQHQQPPQPQKPQQKQQPLVRQRHQHQQHLQHQQPQQPQKPKQKRKHPALERLRF
jgi:hypothetical protein